MTALRKHRPDVLGNIKSYAKELENPDKYEAHCSLVTTLEDRLNDDAARLLQSAGEKRADACHTGAQARPRHRSGCCGP